MKVRVNEEIKQSANIILAKHLQNIETLPEIADAVYAMARAVRS